jgi:hypothetical protein
MCGWGAQGKGNLCMVETLQDEAAELAEVRDGEGVG